MSCVADIDDRLSRQFHATRHASTRRPRRRGLHFCSRFRNHDQQRVTVNRFHCRSGKFLEVVRIPNAPVSLQFIVAKVLLQGLMLRGRKDDCLLRLGNAAPQQRHAVRFFKVLDDVAKKNQIVARYTPNDLLRIANKDFIIKKAMERREIRRVSLDSIDSRFPVLALVSFGIVLGRDDVRVLPKEMAPFAKPDADIEDRRGTKLFHDVNYRWDGVGTAAGHFSGAVRK